jgi:flagellar assembly factor FliW
MTVEFDTAPAIEFVSAMPGFPNHRQFTLARLHDQDLLYALTSVDDPALRFLVVPPVPFFPDYAPEFDDETRKLLDVHDADQVILLLVVTPGRDGTGASANLLAPIVVDRRSRRAAQVVLDGSGLPVRAPLVVSRLTKADAVER